MVWLNVRHTSARLAFSRTSESSVQSTLRATVAIDVVSIIAHFGASLKTISARGGTQSSWNFAVVATLLLTLSITTIVVVDVAVVASLSRGIDDLVTTHRDAHAGLAYNRTSPALVHDAHVATIFLSLVAVVALLLAFLQAITADGSAGVAGAVADPTGLHSTVASATVVSVGVAVVAGLATL